MITYAPDAGMQFQPTNQSHEEAAEIEARLRIALGNRVRDLAVMNADDSWILSGSVPSYHVRQLVQHEAMRCCCGRRLEFQVKVVECEAIAAPCDHNGR